MLRRRGIESLPSRLNELAIFFSLDFLTRGRRTSDVGVGVGVVVGVVVGEKFELWQLGISLEIQNHDVEN